MRHVSVLESLLERQGKVDDNFAISVIDGLSRTQKSLPCRFFYDAKGSALFEEITTLPEYYPTRTEVQILKDNAADIVSGISRGAVLVEFGSGSSLKTEILLDKISERIIYVPVDVSDSALADAAVRIARRFPSLDVRPLVADFSNLSTLPRDLSGRRAIGFFPGSTIGNFASRDAVQLLKDFRRILATGGRLIIGVDLKKDQRTLVRAYDDAAGVTAAFNLNLLARINRELGGNFDLNTFTHEAIYNARAGRIEMHLVSDRRQDVTVCGQEFHFRAGESIHTENSYKYTVGEFQTLAATAGWRPRRVWTDSESLFSVHELV